MIPSLLCNFARRDYRKAQCSQEIEETIEQYLAHLDPYRVSTAPDVLPLPLQCLASASHDEVATNKLCRLLMHLERGDETLREKLLKSTNGPLSCSLVSLYKNEFFDCPRDTLVLSYDISAEDVGILYETAEEIKTRLMELNLFWQELGLPHNLATYDVEILDEKEAWNPRRRPLQICEMLGRGISYEHELSPALLADIRFIAKKALSQSFIDLYLSLDSDASGVSSQFAVVVEVMPHTSFRWAWLRHVILCNLNDRFVKILRHGQFLQVRDFEVEFVINYHAPELVHQKQDLANRISMIGLPLSLLKAASRNSGEDVAPIRAEARAQFIAASGYDSETYEDPETNRDSAYMTASQRTSCSVMQVEVDLSTLNIECARRISVYPRWSVDHQPTRNSYPAPAEVTATQSCGSSRSTRLQSCNQSHDGVINEPEIALDYGRDISAIETPQDEERVDRWLRASSHVIGAKRNSSASTRYPTSDRKPLSLTSDSSRVSFNPESQDGEHGKPFIGHGASAVADENSGGKELIKSEVKIVVSPGSAADRSPDSVDETSRMLEGSNSRSPAGHVLRDVNAASSRSRPLGGSWKASGPKQLWQSIRRISSSKGSLKANR